MKEVNKSPNLNSEETGALQQFLRSRIMKTLGAVVAPFVLISCVMGGPYSIKKFLKPPSLENRVLKVDRNGKLALVLGYGDRSRVWILPAEEVPPNPTEEWLANAKFSDFHSLFTEAKNVFYTGGKLFRFGNEYYLLTEKSSGFYTFFKATFHPDLRMKRVLGAKSITYDPSNQSFTTESGILRISGSGSWTFEKFPPGFKPMSRPGKKTSKFEPTTKDARIKAKRLNS